MMGEKKYSILLHDAFILEWGRAYTPDKQTVKCFEADPDETGSYTLTTKSVITHRYKEKQLF